MDKCESGLIGDRLYFLKRAEKGFMEAKGVNVEDTSKGKMVAKG